MAKFGVQASTIKDTFNDIGTYETLRRVKATGYSAIEMSQVAMSPDNVRDMARAQAELGVKVVALSAMLTTLPGVASDSLADDFDKIVSDCKALDTTILRIGMLPFDAMRSLDTVIDFALKANMFAHQLGDEGVELYYHNHHIEFARFDGRYMLDIIAENAPELGLELDVHWIHRGGLNPVEVLERFSGRVRLVHLKDYRIGNVPGTALESLASGDFTAFMSAFLGVVQFAEVGEGNLDWKPIIDQALASGAEYLLVEQDDTYGRDPFESLAMSRDHLLGLGYDALF